MERLFLTRRALLAAGAATLGCGHRKATGFRGYCFVANEAGRSLAVVDLSRFRVRRQIALDGAPVQTISHPTQHKVLALSRENGTLYEVDAVKLAVARRARAGSTAVSMGLAPLGEAVWVLYRDPAALVEIPLASLRPARRVRLDSPPDGLAIGAGDMAAATSTEARTATLVSLSRGAVERTVATGDEPSHVLFRKDGRHLFLASRPESVLRVVDVATGRTVVRLPLPVEPEHLAIKPDGGQLFISGKGMDAVVVVYVYETQIAETLLAGRAPAGMAAMDSPAYLMAANPETNSVTILDLENNGRLVASVQVGQEPRSIVLTPDAPGEDRYALVLNEKSGDLAVIRIASLPQDAAARRRPTPLFTLIPVGEKPVSAALVSFT